MVERILSRMHEVKMELNTYKLINFTTPLGSYNLEPIYIADFSGLQVFLSFYIIGHKEGSNKTMHLAIYIKTSGQSRPNLEVS